MSPAALVDPVRRFADTVLDCAVPTDGADDLLADALDPESHAIVPYDSRDVVDDRVLTNFISQQEFLRTLVGLSRVTGEPRYEERAESLVRGAFDRLEVGDGLLYWGGHAAYDPLADEPVGQPGKTYHELKADYPFYELFWSVDPATTRRFVESFWDAHVIDWGELDFDRHAEFGVDRSAPWENTFVGDDVFFWGDGLTFANTGSDLFYAAGMLGELDDDPAPLDWAERLASRYVDTRQETGIGGYQFSQHPSYCNGPAIRGDRAQYQFAPYIPGDHLVYEGTLFRPRPYVQERQLILGNRLGALGGRLTRWALEELRAWRDAAYRPSDNTFEPMLTDGFSLDGFVIRREGYFGPKGRVIGPITADSSVLLAYATAYRTTGAVFAEAMIPDILSGLGVASVDGSLEDGALEVTVPEEADDLDLLYSFVELYVATGREEFRRGAVAVADAVLDAQYHNDVFVAGEVAPIGHSAALAVLTAAAAVSEDVAVEDIPLRGDRPGVPPGGI